MKKIVMFLFVFLVACSSVQKEDQQEPPKKSKKEQAIENVCEKRSGVSEEVRKLLCN